MIKIILLSVVLSGFVSQAVTASETTYYFGVNEQHDTNLYLDGQSACNEFQAWYKGNHPNNCGYSSPVYEPVYGGCTWHYNLACSSTVMYEGVNIYRKTCVDPQVPKLVYTTYAHWTCSEPPEPEIPPPEPKSFGEPPCDVNAQVGD
ncbi:MAG: hypothetical protein OQK95_03150 [Gammaproteobacteria bacterium]|nr:hypothetical protein [Gammaproteobacteria bacterium]